MTKAQINLPKTAFSMKANLPTKEPEILRHWEAINLYKELRKSNNGKEKFILHDGPPYANGNIHMGTALNKILKENDQLNVIDLHSAFVDDEGFLHTKYSDEGVHLNEDGYRNWASLINDKITLLK